MPLLLRKKRSGWGAHAGSGSRGGLRNTLLISVIDYHLWKKKNPLAKRINQKAVWFFFLLFIVIYLLFLIY